MAMLNVRKVWVFFGTIAIAVGAIGSLAAVDPAGEAKTIAVTGQVVDEAGAPQAGISVRLARPGGIGWFETASDDEGRFSFTLPLPYHPHYFNCLASSADGRRQGFVETSPEERKSLPERVTVNLKPARELFATVANERGEPVAGADVLAIVRHKAFHVVATDAAGRAVLRVPAGLTLDSVAAIKSGTGLDYVVFQQNHLPEKHAQRRPQESDEPFAFTLRGSREVTVVIKDGAGRPLEGVRVHPWYFTLPDKGGDLNFIQWEKLFRETDENGVATFDFIPSNGEGLITFMTRKEVFFAPERTNLDLGSFVDRVEATLHALVAVKGKVLDSVGMPLAGAEIKAHGAGYSFERYAAQATSKPDGTFEIALAPDLFYLIRASKDRQFSAPESRVVVSNSPTEEIELMLSPGTRVYGRLTVGPEKRPIVNQDVTLMLHPSIEHYALPPHRQLRGPAGNRKAITPHMFQWTQTDEEGRFEFWTGPGVHELHTTQLIGSRKFTVETQDSLEFDLHAERLDAIEFRGRVVLAGEDQTPVAGVSVTIWPDGAVGPKYHDAITDGEGRFTCRRAHTPCLAQVMTKDRKYGAFARIALEQREIELRLDPISTVKGRLVSSETGEPIPNASIGAVVQVYQGPPDDSPFYMLGYVGTNTRDDGTFELSGLFPGVEYSVSVSSEAGDADSKRYWTGLPTLTLETAGTLELGDIELTPGSVELSREQQVRQWFANDVEVATRVRSKLRDARLAHQHLLVLISPEDHPFCREFFAIRLGLGPERTKFFESTANFELMAVQPARLREASGLRDGFADITGRLTDDKAFTLALFSPSGELLSVLPQAALADDDRLDFEKLYAALAAHAPELPDALDLVNQAFAQAKRENKKVLWQHSGAFCGPCILLSRYLDEHRELIERDYVWVKIDTRFRNGEQIVAKYRFEGGGIPWFVIMDADAKPLITSSSETGNIGYPAWDEGRRHFEKMLRETAAKLADADIQLLLEKLK